MSQVPGSTQLSEATWAPGIDTSRFNPKELLARFETLRNDRSSFTSHWQQIAEVLSPAGAVFTDEGAHYQQGSKNAGHVYDTTGIHSNELLSSGFFSLLTSPTTPWFLIHTGNRELNQDYEVSNWLAEVTKIMQYEIQRPQTGFTTSMHEFYLEYGGYGNSTMFATESKNRENLLFITLPLNECYYQENDEGRVDTLFRRYWRTPYQLIERFGYANVHERTIQLLEDPKSNERIEVLHVIMPNRYGRVNGLFNDSLPFLSVYLDKTRLHVMSVSGFQEMPFMAARFYKMPQEVYGRGPGSTALPDINMLQEMTKTVLRGAQKIVDPPMMMPDQGFLTPPNMAPGRVNYFRSGTAETDRIVPLQTGGRPDIGLDLIMNIQNRVREIFFVDQLQLNIGPQMTATEVMQRTEEKQRLMGPVIGRASTELLSPLLLRCFGLLARANKIPYPPLAIQEANPQLKIVYTSPIFKAQEQIAANNVTRTAQVLLPFLSVDPSVMDVFHPYRMAKGIGEVYNVDPKFFRTEDEYQQVQEARAQAAQEENAAANLKDQGIGINALAQAGDRLGGMG